MKFHGIDAQGTLYDQRVSSLPTWTAADLGRIVFLTTNDTLYIASSTGWVALSGVDALTAGEGISITKVSTPAQSITIALDDSFLSSGRKLWIYEDTAPTGWSIVSGCSDGLLAVKGGTGDYNVSGGTALRGSWTQASHSHTVVIDNESSHTHIESNHRHGISSYALTVSEIPSHYHELPDQGYSTPGTYARAWNAYTAKFAIDPPDGKAPTTSTGGSAAHTHGGGWSGYYQGTTAGGTAHTHTNAVSTVSPSSAWRPLANVGIIVEKD